MADAGVRIACVVVTYDALPWIAQCLESVSGAETIVVDNGSSDGTRRPRPGAVSRRGTSSRARTAASPPAGTPGSGRRPRSTSCSSTPTPGSSRTRSARSPPTADRHPRAAAIGPRLSQPRTGRSSAGPRLPDALAPGDRVLLPPQARAALARPQRVLRGRASTTGPERRGVGDGRLPARSAGGVRRGRPVRRAVLHVQRGGRLAAARGRPRLVGRVHAREPSCVHVGGAAHGGRLFRENVSGHLRYLTGSTAGRAKPSARVGCSGRRCLSAAACTAETADGSIARSPPWLGSGDVESLLALIAPPRPARLRRGGRPRPPAPSRRVGAGRPAPCPQRSRGRSPIVVRGAPR